MDTSYIYTLNPGNGDNESAVDCWLKKSGNRDKVFLITKFAYTPDCKLSGSRDDALKACEDSLKKLQVDR